MAQPVNPYVAGAPRRGGRGFFGRQETLEWIARGLRNPDNNSLVLFGQRRIGKTSLLLQLQRTLPDAAFLPIYFDLQDQAVRSLREVLIDLANVLAQHAGTPHPSRTPLMTGDSFSAARSCHRSTRPWEKIAAPSSFWTSSTCSTRWGKQNCQRRPRSIPFAASYAGR